MAEQRPRTPAELEIARRELSPLYKAGYRLFPLSVGGKFPRDKGWQTNPYPVGEIKRWLERGGNIGVVLGDEDLVLDADPRHFQPGEDSLERLEADLDIDLSLAPAVLSGRGDGGRHIYLKKPASLRVVGKLDRYPGLDLKARGGLVVAPGSRHPDTGGLYRHDAQSPPFSEVPPASPELLQAIMRRAPMRQRIVGGGELTVEQLELALSGLNPQDFGQGHYDRWIRLAAACHDATNGAGLDVWLDWAAEDPGYGVDADEANRRTWDSFTAGRPGGASYLTILRELARVGRHDLIARIEPGLVFEDLTPRPTLDIRSKATRLDAEAFRQTANKRGNHS